MRRSGGARTGHPTSDCTRQCTTPAARPNHIRVLVDRSALTTGRDHEDHQQEPPPCGSAALVGAFSGKDGTSSRPTGAGGGGRHPRADRRPPGAPVGGASRSRAAGPGSGRCGSRRLGHVLGRALDDDLAAAVAALGTEVDDPVGRLDTSRLCSITRTVLPWSTSRCSTPSSRRTSSKCSPVVGSSRM